MEQTKLLLKLQEYLQKKQELKRDSELLGLAKELKGQKATIIKAEEENIELLEQAKNNEEKARNLEQQVGKLTEQIKTGKERLYNAKGSGLKELLSLQQSIQKMEDEIKNGETAYWKMINEAEECRGKVKENKDIIKALKTQYNEGIREYKNVKNRVELQIAEQEIGEEEALSQLDKEYLTAYQRMITKFPQNPVAVLNENICSICHLGISSLLVKDIKEGNKVCFCENCGRILVK